MITPEFYDNLTPSEAVALQKELREKINLTPLSTPVRYIGGADISFNKFETTVYAGIVVLKYPEMVVQAHASVTCTVQFPYISGLLAFREVPALLKAWEALTLKPDLLVLDGHGIAHPRRLGIATHFGIVKNLPTIGCAKTRLTGVYQEPGNNRFDHTPLFHKEEQIGTVLRTKPNCNPVFVSPGHKVGMEQSLQIITQCCGKYRIPEPTRLAHMLVNQERVKGSQ
ncbi:deoxyribonuclease V [Niabella drilacis]|uniref:Endonuclease V n=1 Tax=Niabella drilacis (strain DSM 25811 / CCM 8410 / CCUG 62505 / LMG 26954 / E90) TaxID=1285928 RepID=A0A1G6J783_NIADE|nr:deoxyribonuclease V [Niabella drilacis]SDC14571.1 Endonuclease V [Niabella drilacis]